LATKPKIDKGNSSQSEETEWSTGCQKLFANYSSDKGLTSRMSEELKECKNMIKNG
jgi:hypothetical protein